MTTEGSPTQAARLALHDRICPRAQHCPERDYHADVGFIEVGRIAVAAADPAPVIEIFHERECSVALFSTCADPQHIGPTARAYVLGREVFAAVAQAKTRKGARKTPTTKETPHA